MRETGGHVPVMRDRVVALLAPALASGGVYIDATLGLGGHAAAVLDASPAARLIGIDRDPAALAIARDRLAGFGDRVTLVRAVYDELTEILRAAGVPEVQAILADLGLSSLQIDQVERGFSYAHDAPLDMRMGATSDDAAIATPTAGLTAADVVNTYSRDDLARLFRAYGDERHAGRIADAIVAARATQPFTTSARLTQVVAEALPRGTTGGHPSKRIFQALRIEVNDERTALAGFLPAALDALAVGGRLVALSYHSGEDRLVKRALERATTDRVPPGVPVVPEAYTPRFMLLTHGAERPCEEELAGNPRSASARLRAAVRIREGSLS